MVNAFFTGIKTGQFHITFLYIIYYPVSFIEFNCRESDMMRRLIFYFNGDCLAVLAKHEPDIKFY